MPAYKRSAVEKALRQKGFRERKSHHNYFVYYTRNGAKSPIQTKTSHGRKGTDIDDWLLSQMTKQCKLAIADFRGLIDCTLSRDEYEDLLKATDEI